jgi:hypothetical protein
MEQAWGRDSLVILFGTGEPSAIETAVGGRRADADWHEQVRLAVVGAFPGTAAGWVTSSLAPHPGPGADGAGAAGPEPDGGSGMDEAR